MNKTRDIVRTSKEIHYTILAFKVGYSPEYFKRNVLRLLQQLEGECLLVDSRGFVKYVCDGEEAFEEQVREEAKEFLREVGVSG